VVEFANACLQAHGNLTQRPGIGQLAEEHGYKMLPTGEPFGVLVAVEFGNIPFKFILGNQREHLTKDPGGAIHCFDSFGWFCVGIN
jgi:hypothetical protein